MILENLWSFKMLGTDFFHLSASVVVYSILGWFVESVYMSFCNKKITNRGLAFGPICPIYGVGATFGTLLMKPIMGSFFLVYIVGAVVATIFEYIVGVLMIKYLGSLWWNYDNKPYTYKGIICLESSIAWGFYAIGVIEFLNGFIFKIVESIDRKYFILFIDVVFVLAVIDYTAKLILVSKGKVSGEKRTA